MSWDIHYSSLIGSMGTKEKVREQFLAACEKIVGSAIPRRGPTEVEIDASFRYETLFVGAKHAVESFVLVFKITNDLPDEVNHPALAFARQIAAQTGWHAVDSTTGLPLKTSE